MNLDTSFIYQILVRDFSVAKYSEMYIGTDI